MTKATMSKLHRNGIATGKTRDLNAQETLELLEMNRVASSRAWEASCAKANTALIPNGQAFAEQLEALSNILQVTIRDWTAKKLVECGFEPGAKCQINLTTGVILLEA